MYTDQNAYEKAKMGIKTYDDYDLENEMVFMNRKEMQEREQRYELEDDQNALRDMNEFE